MPADVEFTRIDSHVHLWDLADRPQPWTQPFPVLHGSFAPGDLAPELAAAGMEAAVLVQSVDEFDESVTLLALAADNPFLVGVVGWVDLTGDVGAQLDALRGSRGGEHLVGLRHQVQNEPDPRWMSREDVRAGLAVLAEYRMTFDLIVRAGQLGDALELAKALPQLRFVLDHAGKPPLADGNLEAWSSAILALSHCSNVAVKISGLVTEADWQHWQLADLSPVVAHVLNSFGPSRCMFGSDWPVCRLAAEYGPVAGAVEALSTGLEYAAQQQLWGGTAQRWYRLIPRGSVIGPDFNHR